MIWQFHQVAKVEIRDDVRLHETRIIWAETVKKESRHITKYCVSHSTGNLGKALIRKMEHDAKLSAFRSHILYRLRSEVLEFVHVIEERFTILRTHGSPLHRSVQKTR